MKCITLIKIWIDVISIWCYPDGGKVINVIRGDIIIPHNRMNKTCRETLLLYS